MPQDKYNPYELPADTLAYLSITKISPQIVDETVVLPDLTQAVAIEHIQQAVAWHASLGTTVVDPRLGPPGSPMFTSFDPLFSDGLADTSLWIYGNGLTAPYPAAPFVLETAECAPGFSAGRGGGTINITGTDFLDPNTPVSVFIINDEYFYNLVGSTITDTTCALVIAPPIPVGETTIRGQDGPGVWSSNAIPLVIPQ